MRRWNLHTYKWIIFHLIYLSRCACIYFAWHCTIISRAISHNYNIALAVPLIYVIGAWDTIYAEIITAWASFGIKIAVYCMHALLSSWGDHAPGQHSLNYLIMYWSWIHFQLSSINIIVTVIKNISAIYITPCKLQTYMLCNSSQSISKYSL